MPSLRKSSTFSISTIEKLPVIISTIRTAADAVQGAPLPFLRGILSTTANLLAIVQDMKDVHSACAELAVTAAELALAIKSESDQKVTDEAWDSKLEELHKTLEEIESYMAKINRMSSLQRFLRQHSIHRELARRKRLLEQAKATFEITSQIDIKQHLVRHDELLDEIFRAISTKPKVHADPAEYEEDWRKIQRLSKRFRILRQCDVILTYTPHIPITPSDAVDRYYSAEIFRQNIVTVKIYKSQTQQHLNEYKKDLDLLMGVSHPSLSQLFGYSGPTKPYPFLVYYGVMESCAYIQSTLKGISRYKFAARMSSSFISAQGYLKSMNLNWSGCYDDLMVNSDSALWLEISTAQVRPFSEKSFQDDIFAMISKVTHKAVAPYDDWKRTHSNDSHSRVTDATQELSETFDEARKLNLDVGALWVELVMPGFIWEFGENVQKKWYGKEEVTREKLFIDTVAFPRFDKQLRAIRTHAQRHATDEDQQRGEAADVAPGEGQ